MEYSQDEIIEEKKIKQKKRKPKKLKDSLEMIDEEDVSFEAQRKTKKQSRSKKQARKPKQSSPQNSVLADGHFEKTFTCSEEVEKDCFSCKHKLDQQTYLV